MIYEETKVFTDKEIRDTNNHFSVVINSKRHLKKSAIIHNGFDKDVNIRLQGSIDEAFTKPLSVEPIINVPAGKEKLIVTDDLIPYIRLKADCTIAPTTGKMDAWIMGSS